MNPDLVWHECALDVKGLCPFLQLAAKHQLFFYNLPPGCWMKKLLILPNLIAKYLMYGKKSLMFLIFYKYRCKLYCISIKKFDLICPFLLGFDSPLRFQSWAMVCLVSTDNFNRARDFNVRRSILPKKSYLF